MKKVTEHNIHEITCLHDSIRITTPDEHIFLNIQEVVPQMNDKGEVDTSMPVKRTLSPKVAAEVGELVETMAYTNQMPQDVMEGMIYYLFDAMEKKRRKEIYNELGNRIA